MVRGGRRGQSSAAAVLFGRASHDSQQQQTSSKAEVTIVSPPVGEEWEGNHSEFETSLPSQIKSITWRIRNFSSLLKLKESQGKQVLEFSAGEDINLPSKWNLTLDISEDDKLGLFLSLKEYLGPEPNLFAKFDASIKYSCGIKVLQARSIEPTDFKTTEDWGYSNFTAISRIKEPGVLVRDRLTIHLRFELYGKKSVNNTLNNSTPRVKESQLRNEVLNDLGTLLRTGASSDFIIRVPDPFFKRAFVQVKTHKVILAARSPVFYTMLQSNMIESATAEVTIPDLNLNSLNVLLKFIYTGVVDDSWLENAEHIINAADKYDLPSLKDFCDSQLHAACTAQNALDLLQIAKQHNLAMATAKISEFVYVNVDGVVNNV